MGNPLSYRRLLRDTAQRNSRGEWPFEDIFNRELYPAIKRVEGAIEVVDDELGFRVFNLSGAAHELLAEHIRGYVRISHGSACTLTIPAIPADDSDGFSEGDWFRGIQSGSGALTIVAGSGVTINFPETLVLYRQWASYTLINVGSNTWDFDGDSELA